MSDYEMSDELKIDLIIEIHEKVTESEPISLRQGYCVECSFVEDGIYVAYPCTTIKIAKGLK
jgi:hypothetical protein